MPRITFSLGIWGRYVAVIVEPWPESPNPGRADSAFTFESKVHAELGRWCAGSGSSSLGPTMGRTKMISSRCSSRNFRRLAASAVLCCAGALPLSASRADAKVTDFTIFFTHEYEQTSATKIKSLYYYFASFADVSTLLNSSATLSTPTNSSLDMTPESGSVPSFLYETSHLTRAELDSDFPAGSYIFDELNSKSGASVSVTLKYKGKDHFSKPPTLTASSYDGLSGLNPDQSYTFSFDQFSAPSTYLGIIFFTVTDVSTGAVVYSTSTETLTTTGFTVPADTFATDTDYEEELDFSTRREIKHPTCESTLKHQCPSLGEQGWDSRSEVFFATGSGAASVTAAVTAPEASTWTMMLVGFAGLGLSGYRLSERRRLADTTA
jgi:hypothetical protein